MQHVLNARPGSLIAFALGDCILAISSGLAVLTAMRIAHGQSDAIGACAEVGFWEADNAGVKTLLERADVALAGAALEGRNTLRFAS